jgi:dUTP pyrophosphatase
MVVVKVKKLVEDAIIPDYGHSGDAGLDMYSSEDTIIYPGERKLVPTGISMELPEGYVALIWDKSGIASKNGVTKMAGVIDCHYRGEYKILLYNTSREPFIIKKHQKIAQTLIQKVESVEIMEVSELSDTQRGAGGFGSTGLTKTFDESKYVTSK